MAWSLPRGKKTGKEEKKPSKKSSKPSAKPKKTPAASPSIKKFELKKKEKLAKLAQSVLEEIHVSSPVPESGQPEPVFQPSELPDNYGDNHIYLMVRDPYWMYAYWEIQTDHQQYHLKKLGGKWDDVKSVLRVYEIPANGHGTGFFDIELQNMVQSWYIGVQPNQSYYVEIGLLHRDGRFIALARSNQITTPRAYMSEVIDEQWMDIDFEKIYALSGGFEIGKSSAELRKLMEERMKGAISSGSGAGLLSSLSSPGKAAKRGFWFVLDCELVVYGATEPDAKVTMQGKEIKLRPDGTFTLRFALPDGKLVLDTRAESADGVEERTITPVVERHTERPAPVFKKPSP